MQKFLILLLLGFCMACSESSQGESEAPSSPTEAEAKASSPAPVPSIQTLNYEGLQTYMARQEAPLVVYNFWATWCRPCVAELPAFEKLKQEYSDRGVEVVLVSLDFPDQKGRMEKFVVQRDLKSPVLHFDDPNQDVWINGISPEWSGAIPATLLVGEDVYQFKERGFTYEELTEWVESVL